MDISNKTLGLLLVAAIVVSIGGTIFSLDRLDTLSTTGYVPTGTGAVNLSIGATISINVTENSIDFGTCTVLNSPSRFDSAGNPSDLDNENCTLNSAFPNNISIQNDGNVDVNITAAISALPQATFGGGTPGTQSRLSLKMDNATARPGCFGGGGLDDYEIVGNFTTAGAGGALALCNNLSWSDTNDQMVVFAKYWLYQGVSGEADLTVTFTADQI